MYYTLWYGNKPSVKGAFYVLIKMERTKFDLKRTKFKLRRTKFFKRIRTKFNYKIYVITSPSKKQYIGITRRSLTIRWRSHCFFAMKSTKRHTVLGNAIRKYGKDSFSIKSIDSACTGSEAGKLEAFYISKLKTMLPNGYNMSPAGAGCAFGFTHSKETKLKSSNIRKEFYSNPINRKAQSDRASIVYNTKEGKEMQRQRAYLQNNPIIKAKIKEILHKQRSTPAYRLAKSIEQKQAWTNPILLKRHSEMMKEQYKKGERFSWNKGKKTGLYRGKTIEERKALGWI